MMHDDYDDDEYELKRMKKSAVAYDAKIDQCCLDEDFDDPYDDDVAVELNVYYYYYYQMMLNHLTCFDECRCNYHRILVMLIINNLF